MSAARSRLALWLLAAGLGALVWGARLTVVDHFGSDLPYFDQWAGEAAQAIIPFLQGRLEVADLFAPHSEHRVACSRALALALVVAGGVWDARVQCTANAAMSAALAVAIFLFVRPLLDAPWRIPWTLGVAMLFALPIAWNNIVAGFHSQQVFLLGFSVVAIACLLTARPGSARWWCGACGAVFALFSMASGLLAAAAVLGALAVRFSPRTLVREHGATIAVCLLVVAAGIALQVHVPAHDALRAQTPMEFFRAGWLHLQWPVRFFPFFALLGWLPWFLLGRRLARRHEPADTRVLVVFAAGLWVGLQFAATAYARGADAPWPTSRYLDTAVLGLVVNLATLALLLPRLPEPRVWRATILAAVGLGAMLASIGLYFRLHDNLAVDLPAHRAMMREMEANTRAFLQRPDRDASGIGPLPDPDTAAFVTRLEQLQLLAVLPPSVQSGSPTPAWSQAASHLTAAGPAIVAGGAVLMLAAAGCGAFRRARR